MGDGERRKPAWPTWLECVRAAKRRGEAMAVFGCLRSGRMATGPLSHRRLMEVTSRRLLARTADPRL